MGDNPKNESQPTDWITRASMILAVIPTAIIVGLFALILWPLIRWMDELELSGRIDPPDWLAAPVAIVFLGIIFWTWAISTGVIDSRLRKSRDEKK